MQKKSILEFFHISFLMHVDFLVTHTRSHKSSIKSSEKRDDIAIRTTYNSLLNLRIFASFCFCFALLFNGFVSFTRVAATHYVIFSMANGILAICLLI